MLRQREARVVFSRALPVAISRHVLHIDGGAFETDARYVACQRGLNQRKDGHKARNRWRALPGQAKRTPHQAPMRLPHQRGLPEP